MKYKIFICDLDGTLLNDEGQIPANNVKAIKKLEASGIKFVIATGRSKYVLEDFLDTLDYKGPIIWSNGSAVSDKNGETLYTEKLPVDLARDVMTLASEYDVEYMLHTVDGIVGPSNIKRIQGYKRYNKQAKKAHQIPIIIDESLYDNLEDYDILKFSTNSANKQKLYDFQTYLKKNMKEVDPAFAGPAILDIMIKKATKGAGVKALAEQYNIRLEEIITIGDNENDISMLEISGLSLVPEHAKDSVKKFAHHITKDNNVGAVADAIERFVL